MLFGISFAQLTTNRLLPLSTIATFRQSSLLNEARYRRRIPTPFVRCSVHPQQSFRELTIYNSRDKEYQNRKVSRAACLVLLGLTLGQISQTDKQETESDLMERVYARVLEIIEHSESIPGINSDEFSSIRAELVKTWQILVKEGVLEISATDKEIRPIFVTLQAIVEHVLASELKRGVRGLRGFIHTPMPATPLCTKGEISRELVDPSVEVDPARLLTVKARTTIVRDFLFQGGNLFIIYPKHGLSQRTREQQKIYQEELNTHASHLFDVPLETDLIPLEVIGATYVVQDRSGRSFVFAIKMTQAKDPKEMGHFGLWFGPINHRQIQRRLHTVSNFVQQSGSTVLDDAIKK